MSDDNWDELRKLYSMDFARMRRELEHFQQSKIPRCMICKTNLVNAVDRVTGKVSKNLWSPNCLCYYSRNLVLSIG